MNYKNIVISTLFSLSVTACSGLGLSSSFQSEQTIQRFQVQKGVALDTNSRLMWSRCLVGTTWNGYSCEGVTGLFGWYQLQSVAKAANYAGYNDWRVPTLAELKTLADSETGVPVAKIPHLNQLVFPTLNCLATPGSLSPNAPECWQWTSTPIEGSHHYAWTVYFGYGYGSANYERDAFALRLVRNHN